MGKSWYFSSIVIKQKGKIRIIENAHNLSHVEEQPFTRNLSVVEIPEGITKVTVHAHDLVHEYGGKVVTITLPAP